MQKKNRIYLGNKLITITSIVTVIFGTFMIASAEMGNSVGDASYLTSAVIKQVICVLLGYIAYIFLLNVKVYKLGMPFYILSYFIILGLLFSCRIFGQTNGAYAWINIGSVATIQPSEIAKIFMIVFGGKVFGTNAKENNLFNMGMYGIFALIYVLIIGIYQHDYGSALVLFVICYFICMIPTYRELKKARKILTILLFVFIGLFAFSMSDFANELMKKFPNFYIFGRFLAAANPFLYRYDNGYHVIMSLVTFANGNFFGTGYGSSVHKYMNFPNPSTDFILPIIVEELGIFGFMVFIILYFVLLFPIIRAAFKADTFETKIVTFGVSLYFIVHFILNVGGVSALIPLTGVPLLLISSGGSSLFCALSGLALAQSQILRERQNND